MFNSLDSRRRGSNGFVRGLLGLYLGYTGDQGGGQPLQVNGGAYINGRIDISGANGGQIKFPATQNPSSDPNTFDDYEEGTFTPLLTFGGGSTGLITSAAVGFYTKEGDRVIYDLNITLLARGISSGGAAIGGLPFSASATTNRLQTPAIWDSGVALAANTRLEALHISTNLTLYQSGTGGGSASQVTDGNVTSSAQMVISGQYGV